MSSSGDFGNPLRKFKLVFLGEQSGKLLSKIGSPVRLLKMTGHRLLDDDDDVAPFPYFAIHQSLTHPPLGYCDPDSDFI